MAAVPALCVAIVFLSACNSTQPTPGATHQPSPQPTPAETTPPTSDSESESYHHHYKKSWDVAPSLEEQIFDALGSDSMVIVRATFVSLTAKAETISGPPATYLPIHELRFNVHEYLEGSGPKEIVVVVRNNYNFDDRNRALGYAEHAESKRNNTWDNQEAVLFVELSQPGTSSATGSPVMTAEFMIENPRASEWDYTIDSELTLVWLPAQGSARGAVSETTEFVTDGAQTPPSTITLGELKAEIAALRAELETGGNTIGVKLCIANRILRERQDRAYGLEPSQVGETLASGLAAGTNVFKFDDRERFKIDGRWERGYHGWVIGPDAVLFEAVTIDDDDKWWTGYNLGFSTARPLPAGEYRLHYVYRPSNRHPCKFKPYDSYADWTVTVTAPAGTVHEAFFDPVDIGSGVGADASNGVLEPTAFKVGQVSASLQSLKWEGGSTTLNLSAAVSMSGHALDFIALDGTIAHSLDGGAAAVSGSTLTWSVATQPWQAGDKLMLRIRQGGPGPTHTQTAQ